MFKKHTYVHDFGLVSNGWVTADPVDLSIIESIYKKDIREGEERLMLAILLDAVACFQEHVLATSIRGKRLFQEAEEWILDTDPEYVFSFENICDTLALHPDHTRRGLMAWRDAKRKSDSVETVPDRRRKLLKHQYTVRSTGRLARTG